MKKLLLSMLLAGFMISVSAQGILPVNPRGNIIDVDDWTVAGISKSYDRQTTNAVYPMTKMHSDGNFIGCTWTNEDNPNFSGSSTPKRGVGYSYSTDGGTTWSAQENRIGGIPLYWPSYSQWGANGEAILAYSPDSFLHNGVQIVKGLILLTRQTKGQGEWTISSVPYPAGITPSNDCFMAYARMTTSGESYEYIHIMSPMRLPEGQTYKGYYTPTLYYRTQDGGLTWDFKAEIVPEMAGQDWDSHSDYLDGITFSVKENIIAVAFIALGNNGYVLRSHDNGDTWESITFFDSPVGNFISPSVYTDTVYIPTQGCIALDNNGKIHIAFSVVMATNSENEGSVNYFSGWSGSFLSYWNEDMSIIDGSTDFVFSKIYPLLYDYFDWNLSDEESLYVKSTDPQWPIIGYFTPVMDEHYFSFDKNYLCNLYCAGDWFSFPQIAFDVYNNVHLVYLGLLDGGYDGDDLMHHPFYTSSNDGGLTWKETEYLIKTLNLVNKEFAYLTLAGNNYNRIHFIVQVDQFAGTHIGGHHEPTDNYFYHFYVEIGCSPPPCPPVKNIKVTFESSCTKATITWSDNNSNEGYIIRRDGEVIGSTSNTIFTDNFQFEKGQSYTWSITKVCYCISSTASVTATADCTNINDITTDATTVHIYPNPANNTVTINAKGFAKVEVFNTVGQIIESKTVNTVDVSDYNNGIYFFKVFDADNNCVTKRVMVAK